MKKYTSSLIIFSMSMMMMSMFMLLNKMFISIEIPLINFFTTNLSISLIMDWMSLMFLATVSFISSMIYMFSMFYIPKKEHNQFSMLMMMFIISMWILILSDNLFLILLGWDGLGLSSYILVIYYQNFSSAASGSITLLSNRLGDIAILLTIAIMMCMGNWNFSMNKDFILITMMLMTMAACSKSAQFPFSAWLPAAMAAPTPISALVHSSTLVTAGVFLMIRIMNNPHPIILQSLLIISSMTAIYSSMAAIWEQDMKKIIALSTLSQIAMMMFAISMNSITLTFFHLITHAMFKSLMFLCAGVMIHNSSYQDMRMMGVKMFSTPSIPLILGISNMALMAIPFMSGFFSKDIILEKLISSKLNSYMTMLMIASVGMTSLYSTRMTILSLKSSSNFNPFTSIHYSNNFNTPIMLMAPMAITSGSMLSWMINPEQMMLLPLWTKFTIFLSLILGVLLGMTLSFKKKSYIKLGQSAISLWFNHTLSSSIKNNLTKIMNMFLNNDKQWQEIYGPQSINMYIMYNSTMISLSISSFLFLLIMMYMIPMMII